MPADKAAQNQPLRWDLSDLQLFITTELTPTITRLMDSQHQISVYQGTSLDGKRLQKGTWTAFNDLFDQLQRLINAWRPGGYYRYTSLPHVGELRGQLLNLRIQFIETITREDSLYRFTFKEGAFTPEHLRNLNDTLGRVIAALNLFREQQQKDLQEKTKEEPQSTTAKPEGKTQSKEDKEKADRLQSLKKREAEFFAAHTNLFKLVDLNSAAGQNLLRIAYLTTVIHVDETVKNNMIAKNLGNKNLSSEEIAVLAEYAQVKQEIDHLDAPAHDAINLTNLAPEKQLIILSSVLQVEKTIGHENTQKLFTSSGEELRHSGTSTDHMLLQIRDQMITIKVNEDNNASGDAGEKIPRLLADEEVQYVDDLSLIEALNKETPNLNEGLENNNQYVPVQSPRPRGRSDESFGPIGNALNWGTKSILSNPVALGLSAGAGVGVVGLLTQGAAGAVGGFLWGTGGGIAGAIAGAEFGAGIGTAILPGIGTAIGGFVGGIAGGIGGATVVGGGSLLIHVGSQSVAQITGGAVLNGIGALAGGGGGSAAASTAGSVLNAATATATQAAGSAALGGANVGNAILTNLAAATHGGVFSTVAGAAGIVMAPIAVVTAGTIVAMSALTGAYLLPEGAGANESKYVTLSKTADTQHEAEPKTVNYTITVTGKSGYTIQVTDAKDVITLSSKGTPNPALVAPKDVIAQLNGKTITETSPATITYSIPFDSTYKDTLINNNFTLSFKASGNGENTTSTFTTSATVSFGNPPAGCWPVTGTISTMDFYTDTGGAHSRWNIQTLGSAYDIGAPEGTPVYAPFSGTAIICKDKQPLLTGISDNPFNNKGNPCYNGSLNPALGATPYGNHIVLHTDQYGDIMFGHLSAFANSDANNGDTFTATAGEQIGFVGCTGNCGGAHLHYETLNAPHSLAEIVPQDPVPTLYMKVSSNSCGGGTPQK